MKPFNNVIVSATEPKNADVWIQHAENIFDKNKANFINGYFNEESTSIATSSVSKCLYLEIEGNKEYCITKKASARFNVGTTSEVPNVGVNLIDNAKNVTTANTQKNASQIILKASVSAKYMIIWYYASNDDTLSENEILDSIIIKENIQDDILVNDNGVYNSVFKKSVKICDKTNEEYNINVKAYKYGKIIKVVLYTTNVTKQINQGQQNIVLADLGLENGAIVENTEMITFVYGSDTKNATLAVDGNGLVMLAYIYSNIPTSYQIAQSIIYITK